MYKSLDSDGVKLYAQGLSQANQLIVEACIYDQKTLENATSKKRLNEVGDIQNYAE